MKIRTSIAAACAALVFSMAGPIHAHDGKARKLSRRTSRRRFPISPASR